VGRVSYSLCLCRVDSLADIPDIEAVPVLFVDSSDAPAPAVASAITKFADEVHADLIIAAKSNKVGFP
jgi:hypothetical protein